MSSPFDGMATYRMTVFKSTVDDWGAKAYVVSGVVACEYQQGGSMQRDAMGGEFVPISTFYPVQSDVSISVDDFVVLGDYADTTLTPAKLGAEVVKKIGVSGNDYFNWGTETVVYTG